MHAQACILFIQQDPVDYISFWFSKKKYLETYQENILPVNGSILWHETNYTKPLPPIARRMPGRPTIKRKRHVSEHQDRFTRISSKGKKIQCRNCFQFNHNIRSCKNPKVTPPPKPKKKMGRPRLNVELTHYTGRGRGRGSRDGRGGRSQTASQTVQKGKLSRKVKLSQKVKPSQKVKLYHPLLQVKQKIKPSQKVKLQVKPSHNVNMKMVRVQGLIIVMRVMTMLSLIYLGQLWI